MELKLFELNKNLLIKKKQFISSFNLQDKPENLFDPKILDNVKKNFNFEFNEEENKVDISSKFNVPEENINESIEAFEKSLQKKVLNFLDDFSKLKFYIKG